ncbi:unnamed protein product [Closterium sp. NIES-53]
MDAEMASRKSTGTYVDEVPPPGANIVDGMWIFRVKRPPGSPPAFKARYVARGFSQQQGRAALPRIVFIFLAGQPSRGDLAVLPTWLHWVVSCGYPVEPPAATLWYPPGAPRVARHTEDYTSSADPSLFLCTDTTLPPFYVLVHVVDMVFATADTKALALVLQRFGFHVSSPQPTPLSTGHALSDPPSDESVEPSGPYPELVGCLICEAEIYVGAMAAQELRWLTYLRTDLGERPRSPPFQYVDNKAMLALIHEQRLEHRMKHIALRYFLARELQQRRQLCLYYMASRANTVDVFTKALGSGDHQRFCTALGLVPTLPHLLVAWLALVVH